jgi:hypothetical protein
MPKTNPAKVLPRVTVHVLRTATAACALAVLLGACGAPAKPTRRIEPGDIVFRNWSYLSAYKEEVGRIVATNMAGITAADLAARGQALAAQIKKETADLTVKYVESGRTWDIPPGTVATIVGYYDSAGNETKPKVEGDSLYAADGNALFAKISWDGKEGYMAVDRTH